MRKTKIICTLGPASETEQVLREMIEAGMNVARFNFSHGSHEEHLKRLKLVKKLRKEMDVSLGALLDTKGPEIRLGKIEGGKTVLKDGDPFTLTTEQIVGDNTHASVSFQDLTKDVKEGDRILIDDGLIELQVQKVSDKEIQCVVLNGGPISDHKGVNVPNVELSMPYLSDKDRDDIKFGIEAGFDFIAASFTRCAQDILQIREILEENGCNTIKIIAKIENAQGVNNIDEILRVSDGIMIARGDMGVEIPLEDVPIIQKMIIQRVYNSGKYVITATQMLDSMMNHPRPTRSEATDVANAIYDGTSVIMLSGETAAGKYPVESVKTMARIAERTEEDINYRRRFREYDSAQNRDVTNAISHATCSAAYDLEASAIITVTQSGQTARMISKYRPQMPIIGCTTQMATYRHLSMSWGVMPVLCEEQNTEDALFKHAMARSKECGFVKDGDLVVITAGVPLGIPGTTNLLKVQTVGDVILHGMGIGGGNVKAGVCVAKSEREALQNFKAGDILVIDSTTNELLDVMKKASGIITAQPGVNSHAAIVGLALNIPVIVGAKDCTQILRNGTSILLDASKGIVCNLTNQQD